MGLHVGFIVLAASVHNNCSKFIDSLTIIKLRMSAWISRGDHIPACCAPRRKKWYE